MRQRERDKEREERAIDKMLAFVMVGGLSTLQDLRMLIFAKYSSSIRRDVFC